MEFTDHELEEFRKIYEDDFHQSISIEDARSMASRLLRLYEALARPLPSERGEALDSHDASTVG